MNADRPDGDRLDAIEHRLTALEDREAIRRRLDAYATAIDVRDRAALGDLVTQDVAFVVTADGTERHGRDALIDYLAGLLAPMGPTVHAYLGAVDIILDADTATSTHKGLALHELDGEFQVALLTYEHTWRREDGTWRISRRRIVPWVFCSLAQLLATGWDPAGLQHPLGPPRRLPWCSRSWLQRFDHQG